MCLGVLGVTSFAAALSSLAEASPDGAVPVSLRWSAPRGCPREQDVLDQISRILANRPVTTSRSVVAKIQYDGGQWRAVLEMSTDESRSRRELEASSCAALAEATALIVAVSIDPDLAFSTETAVDASFTPLPAPELADAGAHDGSGPSVSGVETPAAGTGVAGESERRAARTPVTWGLQAGVGATGGLLPAAAVGVHGGVFGAVGRLGARIDGHLLLPTDAAEDATFGALRVRAQLCPELLEAGRVGFTPCAGVETNAIWGRGRGVTDPRSSTATFVAPLVSAHANFELTARFSLGVSVDGALALQRPAFELAGRPVFRVASVLGGGHAEARVRW